MTKRKKRTTSELIEEPLKIPIDMGKAQRISISRLEKDIIELGKIGRREDGGIYRMAFSDADIEARRWLIEKGESVGLRASMDPAANVFLLDDRSKTNSSFMIGSHLDSVPCGGMIDGTLGVLVALECMRVIRENDIELSENLELVATSDEEGRFGGMLGSQAICGELSMDFIRRAKDVNEVSLIDAMKKHNLNAINVLKAKRHREYLSGFLELHIEQGPVLEKTKCDIGIVEDISGLFKWKVKLIGEANHSGTTPMNMRRDSFQGLAEFAHEIPRLLEENGSEYARATIGKVDLFPGNPHTVPGVTEFTIVGRDFDDEHMQEIENACRKTISAICRRRGLMFEFEELSRLSPTACDQRMVSLIEGEAQKLNLKYMRMKSGAGHDAQIFGRHIPSGMIFIPSLNGVSHSPEEWSSLEHIEMGANLLLRSILRSLAPHVL